MTKYIQILTTVDKKKHAENIARMLIEKRLAACIQMIGPIQSTYWWQDNIETSKEWLCLIKTKENLYPAVEKNIKAIHPYQVPEIIALPITRGYHHYLQWIAQETKPSN